VSSPKRIVIIGGGFSGLAAAQHLKGVNAQITLIDRRNFHLFQPLLYQVATGGLSPANISVPLRAALKRQRNMTVLLGEVDRIDVAAQTVTLNGEKTLQYDYLIVAAGSGHHYFGHPEWEQYAPGLKTIEDAIEIRRRVLLLFETAELEEDPRMQDDLLRFVVVGGGPTGVELAGALGEIAHQTLKGNFRRINPASSQILLMEGGAQILSGYSDKLVAKAKRALSGLGVTVRENTLVKEVGDGYILVQSQGRIERIKSRCVLWAAGVKASPLGAVLAQQTGAETDKSGRVFVGPDLSVPGHPEIYVIGDLAAVREARTPLPGVAPVAIQEGEYVASVLQAKLSDSRADMKSFHYRDKGAMTTVGRSFAIVQLRHFAFAGFGAWLLWLWVHIIYLAQFTNRLLVVIQWGWNYFTLNRSARIITNRHSGE
jgi:NADH dehydrogenase